MNALPPRILVALAISAVAIVALVGVWISGGGDEASPTTTTTSSSTTAASTVATVAPTPISILPDWYRKGSSRYEDRRPTTSAPPDGLVTTPSTTTTAKATTTTAKAKAATTTVRSATTSGTR